MLFYKKQVRSDPDSGPSHANLGTQRAVMKFLLGSRSIVLKNSVIRVGGPRHPENEFGYPESVFLHAIALDPDFCWGERITRMCAYEKDGPAGIGIGG